MTVSRAEARRQSWLRYTAEQEKRAEREAERREARAEFFAAHGSMEDYDA